MVEIDYIGARTFLSASPDLPPSGKQMFKPPPRQSRIPVSFRNLDWGIENLELGIWNLGFPIALPATLFSPCL
jgi:hypothetical protein